MRAAHAQEAFPVRTDPAREGLLSRRQELVVFALGVLIAAAQAISVSYLDEDAFISFRSVEHLLSGHGLRYNIDERVQPFTNPLWVLALIPLRALLGNIQHASMLLSIVCSTGAVAIVAWPLRREPLLLVLAFFLPLFLSQAFTDYSSSGFENPLTFVLLAAFAVQLLTQAEIAWGRLTLYTALIAVNRLDHVLLVAPAMLWLYVANFRHARQRAIALGALPLVLWLLFSLFYFGMPFPNTKAAKLNAGFETAIYLEFGWAYVVDIARNDTVTFAGLVGGLATALIAGVTWFKKRDPFWERVAMLGAGIALISIYVVYIGGCFMAGRHWSAPFFLAVIVMAFSLRQWERAGHAHVFAFTCALLVCELGAEPLLRQRDTIETRDQKRFAVVRTKGIRDQRFGCSFYEALIGSRGPVSEHSWSKSGLYHRKRAERFAADHPGQRYVVVHGGAGKAPFHAGPDVIYVDPLALTDPLMAHLPDVDGKFWFSGHLGRHVPKGYAHARRTGSLDQMDPDLAAYYDKIRVITRGPLFSWQRIETIARFHLGKYDHHLNAYLKGGYPRELGKK